MTKTRGGFYAVLAVISVLGIAFVVAGWIYRNDNFQLGLYLNLGTGAALFTGLGLLTGQFDKRVSELEANASCHSARHHVEGQNRSE